MEGPLTRAASTPACSVDSFYRFPPHLFYRGDGGGDKSFYSDAQQWRSRTFSARQFGLRGCKAGSAPIMPT